MVQTEQNRTKSWEQFEYLWLTYSASWSNEYWFARLIYISNSHYVDYIIQTTARHHLLARYKKIKLIIQSTHSQLTNFQIESEEESLKRILLDISNEVNSWKGVETKLCKKKKTTFKQYKRTSTNWFNRNKAKIFGNHFFFPLIFKHVLNVCCIFMNWFQKWKFNLFLLRDKYSSHTNDNN